MIYFDNSSSSFVKPKNVQRAVLNALSLYTANPGRGGHREAVKTGMEVEKVREQVAKHVGTSANNVIFTYNCTDAINLAIQGLYKSGNVVCTVNEHNSVSRLLNTLKK